MSAKFQDFSISPVDRPEHTYFGIGDLCGIALQAAYFGILKLSCLKKMMSKSVHFLGCILRKYFCAIFNTLHCLTIVATLCVKFIDIKVKQGCPTWGEGPSRGCRHPSRPAPPNPKICRQHAASIYTLFYL